MYNVWSRRAGGCVLLLEVRFFALRFVDAGFIRLVLVREILFALLRVGGRSLGLLLRFILLFLGAADRWRLPRGDLSALHRFALRALVVVAVGGRLSYNLPFHPLFRDLSPRPAVVRDGGSSLLSYCPIYLH